MVTISCRRLHRLGPFVGCFQLRIHPFLGQETGAILRDPKPAHQADRLPQQRRTLPGIPEFGGRATSTLPTARLTTKSTTRFVFQLGQTRDHRVRRPERPTASGTPSPVPPPLWECDAGRSPTRMPSPAKISLLVFSSSAYESKCRAAANPSEQAASPAAQISTNRWTASSFVCSPAHAAAYPAAPSPPRNRSR